MYSCREGLALSSSSEFFNTENELISDEGRILRTDFEAFVLFNIYFPNATMEGKLQLKLKFCQDLLKIFENCEKEGKNIIVVGDFNIAHKDFDVYNPDRCKEKNKPCTTQEERGCFDHFLQSGLVDTFREIYPELPNQFSVSSLIDLMTPLSEMFFLSSKKCDFKSLVEPFSLNSNKISGGQ